MISHRPRSQNILKKQALNPEKDSRIKRPRSHVSLDLVDLVDLAGLSDLITVCPVDLVDLVDLMDLVDLAGLSD